MNYSETLEYIKSKDSKGIVPGLDSIKNLLGMLGNPERLAPALHIAGTNGKGSIMAYVETILRMSGLKAGRYISPAIFDYRDRWIIDGKLPSPELVAETFTELMPFVEKLEEISPPGPTSFEIETAAYFEMCRKEKCGVFIVECGMGGRLDATNVFESTPVTVLAKISMDHMKFLGDSLIAITKEKLGIVKEGDTLVTYPQDDIVMDFIREYVNSHFNHVKLVEVDMDSLGIISETASGSRFIYKEKEYEISLIGRHQIYNAVTAIETVNAFFERNLLKDSSIKDIYSEEYYKTIYNGLKNTVWRGRFEKLMDEPSFYIDGAHNYDAWVTLAENLERYFTYKKKVFIIGVFSDKEYDKMLDVLTPYMDKAVTVTAPNNDRALDGKVLAGLIEEKGISAVYEDSFYKAVKRAISIADSDTVIIACGSLSFVGDISTAVEEIGKQ